jgi:hypothetical protein
VLLIDVLVLDAAGFAPVPPTPTTTTEPQARAAAASAPAGPTLPDSGIIFDAVTLLTAKFWRKVCNANLLQDYVKVLDAAGQPLSPETPGPAFTTRAIAIQFLSMYDAYAGINGLKMYTKTLTPPTVPAGTSFCPRCHFASECSAECSALDV